MKKMKKRFVVGTAFALGAAASLTGCRFLPHPSVYGPAPSSEIKTGQETTYKETETFGAEDEVMETVYGPPEYFAPEEELQGDVYGPPEFFAPEEELQEDVYGPPAFFDGEN